MKPLLGCIADDYTGATDLASTLVAAGLRTVQVLGVPEGELPEAADAVVVALKSRTAPVDEAVAQSLAALDWLREAGCQRYFFKYCSTFDSTPQGNIGPVAEALAERLGAPLSIVCPGFPANQRSVYGGHLFVGDRLLSESSLASHPLTPMTDANLTRWLQHQTQMPIDRVTYAVVESGPAAIRQALDVLAERGVRFAVMDALRDAHLEAIGRACAGDVLATGGSAIATGLVRGYREAGLLGGHGDGAATLPSVAGPSLILSGSCSQTTNRQVRDWIEAGGAALRLRPERLADDGGAVEEALAWARDRLDRQPVLIYATAPPDEVANAQEGLGAAHAGSLVEAAFARLARELVDTGVRRLVVAGGETSGAVVSALGARALRIGASIDPGVPWTTTLEAEPIALALKSGNFGAPDFFHKALAMTEESHHD